MATPVFKDTAEIIARFNELAGETIQGPSHSHHRQRASPVCGGDFQIGRAGQVVGRMGRDMKRQRLGEEKASGEKRCQNCLINSSDTFSP